jgi:hypothetical protein
VATRAVRRDIIIGGSPLSGAKVRKMSVDPFFAILKEENEAKLKNLANGKEETARFLTQPCGRPYRAKKWTDWG